MASSFFGKGIPLAAGFDFGAKNPLDSRVVVNTRAELNEHSSGNRAYPGLTVYVIDEDANYQFDGTDWIPFGRGSGATSLVNTYNDIALLENSTLGGLVYVASDANKNNEPNIYVVTEVREDGNKVIPVKYVSLSSFAKSQIPTLSYDSGTPEGVNIYKNKDEDVILTFNFTSDNFGDGKYRIYKDGGLLRSFSAAKGIVMVNLGPITTNGSYSITVTATDYFGIPAPQTLEWTVIVGGLELSSTFDETLASAIFEVGNEIAFPYLVTCADTSQKIKMQYSITKQGSSTKVYNEELSGSTVSSGISG